MISASTVWFRLRSELSVRRWAAAGVTVGSHVRFTGAPIISMAPSTRIVLGDRVRLISANRAAALGLNHPVVLRTLLPGAEILIGDDVGITGGTICSAVRVEIGAGTLLGANVTICDTDFHPLVDSDRRYSSLPDPLAGHAVIIGANVFVGTGAIILKGTSIGDNSVIGAGAIVSGNIPADSLAAGNPARILRTFAGG